MAYARSKRARHATLQCIRRTDLTMPGQEEMIISLYGYLSITTGTDQTGSLHVCSSVCFRLIFSVINEVGNADILVIQTPRGFPTIFHLLSNFLSLTELGKC